MNIPLPTSPLLDTESAATELDVSASFLNKARLAGNGPRFVKIGRAVRYERTEIALWLAGQRRHSTSHKDAARLK